MKHIIGFDAKRLVRNASGLGNYSRTLVGDLLRASSPDWSFRLYAPDEGNPALAGQLENDPRLTFCYPGDSSLFTLHSSLKKSLWRSYGIVEDLVKDGVQVYHGLSGELPIGIRKSGIRHSAERRSRQADRRDRSGPGRNGGCYCAAGKRL